MWAVETAAGLAAVGLEVALGLDGLEVGVMAAEPAEETAEALRARVGIPVALAVAVAGVVSAAAAAFRAGGVVRVAMVVEATVAGQRVDKPVAEVVVAARVAAGTVVVVTVVVAWAGGPRVAAVAAAEEMVVVVTEVDWEGDSGGVSWVAGSVVAWRVAATVE